MLPRQSWQNVGCCEKLGRRIGEGDFNAIKPTYARRASPLLKKRENRAASPDHRIVIERVESGQKQHFDVRVGSD